jgi:anti-sigma factor RsiW
MRTATPLQEQGMNDPGRPEHDLLVELVLRNAAEQAVGPCLGNDEIAALLDGIPDEQRPEWIAHLASCPECRHRLSTVSRLMGDESVVSEQRRLEASTGVRTRRLAAGVAGLAAVLLGAFALGLLLRPEPPVVDDTTGGQVHRDGIITTTVAPRLVSPAPGARVDALRWTSVPHADRYQVLVFDREGTMVWEPQTADTAVALPASLLNDTATYTWKVEARTGWDRWVASEWGQFSVAPEGRAP